MAVLWDMSQLALDRYFALTAPMSALNPAKGYEVAVAIRFGGDSSSAISDNPLRFVGACAGNKQRIFLFEERRFDNGTHIRLKSRYVLRQFQTDRCEQSIEVGLQLHLTQRGNGLCKC
jgi:hypothetical protein